MGVAVSAAAACLVPSACLRLCISVQSLRLTSGVYRQSVSVVKSGRRAQQQQPADSSRPSSAGSGADSPALVTTTLVAAPYITVPGTVPPPPPRLRITAPAGLPLALTRGAAGSDTCVRRHELGGCVCSAFGAILQVTRFIKRDKQIICGSCIGWFD